MFSPEINKAKLHGNASCVPNMIMWIGMAFSMGCTSKLMTLQ
jgi:hypothetical protein